MPPKGDGLRDVLVAVEQIGGDGFVEGLLDDATPDDDDAFHFEVPFTVLTDEAELIVCPGTDCHVELV